MTAPAVPLTSETTTAPFRAGFAEIDGAATDASGNATAITDVLDPGKRTETKTTAKANETPVRKKDLWMRSASDSKFGAFCPFTPV
jgi:hypothetical protein